MRLRNQISVALVTMAIALPATLMSAKQTMPHTRSRMTLVKVGSYPTRVVATVKSVEIVSGATGSVLGQTSIRASACCLVKLRIQSSRALTPMGTPIQQDESIRVISVQPLDKTLIGKTVQASIELRTDDTREQWLLTDLLPRE